MSRTHQQGWVAWTFSAILFIAGSATAWFYFQSASQNDQLNADLTRAQTLQRTTERNLQRSEQEKQTLQGQLDNALASLSQIEAQYETANRRLTQLNNANDDSATQITTLEAEKQTLQTQVDELTEQLSTAQSQLDTAVKEAETAREQAAAAQQTLAEYQTTLNRLQGELSEAATTEELYLAAREQLALKQAENETYTETIERLKTEMAAETEAMAQLENKLQDQLAKLNQEKEKLVTQLEDGTTAIKLPESILFASGSAELNSDGLNSLNVLADALQSFPNHLISIQGHTDSRKISASTRLVYPTNWELSAARAASAVRELLKKGIPAQQLQAVGYADTRPLVEETDAASRQQNRRIEVILLPNQFKTKILK
ncbi:OmpA family protein [Reinekea sp. G2M2-21]|uniref:OmpA family protein n=1 Tax=Reinekea sp. G2M2-21 TaxID=2788942 RepID=UPI0018AC644F|nr:OmpA family protein [Reinekea sp. G2M2-21]